MASYLVKRIIYHLPRKKFVKTHFTAIILRFLGDKRNKRPQYIPDHTTAQISSNDTADKKEKNVLEFPEEPTIPCCMTGCPNCVWLEYAETLERYFKDGGARAVKEINEKVKDPNIKAYLLTELRIRKT